jgi:hypothetical protein
LILPVSDCGIIFTRREVVAMEIILIILLVGCIMWLGMKMRNRVYASDEATLARAWRMVLNDPNYKERRLLEERKNAAEREAQTLAEAARQTSQSAN